jgi:NitT/TauT family transport system substrate-binding protein
LRLLANSTFNSLKLYSNGLSITSLDDIVPNDKISIVSVGGTPDMALKLYSKERYGDYNKFDDNLWVLQYPEVFASISTSDDITGALITFPSTVTADEHEKTIFVEDLTPVITNYGLGVTLSTNEDFYNQNPALIDIFYKVAGDTIDFMNNNPGEAAQILSEFYEGLDPADIEAQIKSAPPTLDVSENAYNTVAELMQEMGILTKEPLKFNELPNYDKIPKVK